MPYPQNPDRVSPWVLLGVGIGAALAAAAAVIFDVNVSVKDAQEWGKVVLFLLGLLGGGVGALGGARRAKQDVTPILTAKGDQPRALDGTPLEPAGHTPSTGYLR